MRIDMAARFFKFGGAAARPLPRKPGFFEDASRVDAKNRGISDPILCVQDRFDHAFASDLPRRMPRITPAARGSQRGTNDNRLKHIDRGFRPFQLVRPAAKAQTPDVTASAAWLTSQAAAGWWYHLNHRQGVTLLLCRERPPRRSERRQSTVFSQLPERHGGRSLQRIPGRHAKWYHYRQWTFVRQ